MLENAGLRCKLKTPLHRDVSLDDLNVKITDFTKEEKLGSGHYGTVFAGTTQIFIIFIDFNIIVFHLEQNGLE